MVVDCEDTNYGGGDFTPNNSFNNQQEINIQNLPKGIYYLQIIDNQNIMNKIFVKN